MSWGSLTSPTQESAPLYVVGSRSTILEEWGSLSETQPEQESWIPSLSFEPPQSLKTRRSMCLFLNPKVSTESQQSELDLGDHLNLSFHHGKRLTAISKTVTGSMLVAPSSLIASLSAHIQNPNINHTQPCWSNPEGVQKKDLSPKSCGTSNLTWCETLVLRRRRKRHGMCVLWPLPAQQALDSKIICEQVKK